MNRKTLLNLVLVAAVAAGANCSDTTETAEPGKNGGATWRCAVSAGGTWGDRGKSIAVDGSGNTYITGEFKGSATFGSTTLTAKSKGDIFVAKLDNSGKFAWALAAGGTSMNDSYSIAVDGSGNTYNGPPVCHSTQRRRTHRFRAWSRGQDQARGAGLRPEGHHEPRACQGPHGPGWGPWPGGPVRWSRGPGSAPAGEFAANPADPPRTTAR